MRNVQILDCTLRDGGRIINCEYSNEVIAELAKGMTDAGIDIVEMGFLRAHSLVEYKGNSTFFTEVSQIKPFIPQNRKKAMYVAFVDFEMYDFSCLERCQGDSVTGIRVGFTKKQFEQKSEEIKESLIKVKEMGYELFVQGVNTLAYTDRELLELIDLMNQVMPHSFGIVDTYGAMYLDDIVHFYNLVDYNLNKDICIDIHSHNNFQSSFAFAQQIISLSGDKRNIILDSTLNGMGKCAGNLNTELIVDYLTRKHNYDYNTDAVLDMIDRYLYPIKKNHEWGYSIPAFMAGLYKAHPNNIIYLTEKYRLNSKDIKYIISAIDEKTRQRYDYDNIKKIYKDYCSNKIDDSHTIEELRNLFTDKKLLILAPGGTIEKYHDKIIKYIREEKPIVICVNFIPKELPYDYLFYANTIHWEKINDRIEHNKCILTSNIHIDVEYTYLVDYSRLVAEDSSLYDNSTIMLLNLLKLVEVKEIALAGFDGLKEKEKNYVDDTFPNQKISMTYEEINTEIKKLVGQYRSKTMGKIKIEFLTPSFYEE